MAMLNIESESVVVNLTKESVAHLKLAASVVNKRVSKPILHTVKLSVHNGMLTATSTDLETWITTLIADYIEHDTDIDVIVDVDVVKSLKAPKGKNTMSLLLTSDGVSFDGITTKSFDVAEYPIAPLVEELHTAVVEPSYVDQFAAVAVSASSSEIRPLLTGVCHRRNTLIATDGMRLTQFTRDDTDSLTVESNVIVPATIAKTMKKCAKKTTHHIGIEVDEYRINYSFLDEVGTEQVSLTTRLIDGNYPDITRIIPQSHRTVINVDVAQWLTAHEKALQTAKSKDNRMVNLSIEPSTGVVELSTKSDMSEYETDLQCNGTGDELAIAYNCQYMIDALKQVDDIAVTIGFNGNNQPFTITNFHENKLALISPISLR